MSTDRDARSKSSNINYALPGHEREIQNIRQTLSEDEPLDHARSAKIREDREEVPNIMIDNQEADPGTIRDEVNGVHESRDNEQEREVLAENHQDIPEQSQERDPEIARIIEVFRDAIGPEVLENLDQEAEHENIATGQGVTEVLKDMLLVQVNMPRQSPTKRRIRKTYELLFFRHFFTSFHFRV